HVNIMKNMISAATIAKSEEGRTAQLMLVLRSDGDAEIEEKKRGYRAAASQAGIPVFNEIVEAARALACLRIVEQTRCCDLETHAPDNLYSDLGRAPTRATA